GSRCALGLPTRPAEPPTLSNSHAYRALATQCEGAYETRLEPPPTPVPACPYVAGNVGMTSAPALAACGAWALAELQRLCQMAKAPPTGGEWRAWYARLCKLIDQYHDRQDDAGRFTRRLLRELDSLWVFLAHHGVEPTNNRAERALRFGVQWRKRS